MFIKRASSSIRIRPPPSLLLCFAKHPVDEVKYETMAHSQVNVDPKGNGMTEIARIPITVIPTVKQLDIEQGRMK